MIDEAKTEVAADGLLDVSGLTLDELSALVKECDLGRALDHIISATDNSVGFHGFDNYI